MLVEEFASLPNCSKLAKEGLEELRCQGKQFGDAHKRSHVWKCDGHARVRRDRRRRERNQSARTRSPFAPEQDKARIDSCDRMVAPKLLETIDISNITAMVTIFVRREGYEARLLREKPERSEHGARDGPRAYWLVRERDDAYL